MESKRRGGNRALEQHLGYWLRRVSNRVSGEFQRALQERETSVAEWVVLCELEERRGMTRGELAEELGLTRGAISKVIDKLELKAWVVSVTSAEDQRVRVLSLTRSGRKVLPELRKIADGNDEAFFGVLGRGERKTLEGLLKKLIAQHQIEPVPVE